jgi:hypothetical protein
MSLQIQTRSSRLWLLLMRALKEKQYCLSGRDAVCELKIRGLIGVAEVPELETGKKRSRGCVVLCSRKMTVMRLEESLRDSLLSGCDRRYGAAMGLINEI